MAEFGINGSGGGDSGRCRSKHVLSEVCESSLLLNNFLALRTPAESTFICLLLNIS